MPALAFMFYAHISSKEIRHRKAFLINIQINNVIERITFNISINLTAGNLIFLFLSIVR